MFNAVEGGAFVPVPDVSNERSDPLFTSGHPGGGWSNTSRPKC
jgi:hypothetical protein